MPAVIPPSRGDIQGQTYDSDGVACYVCPCCSKCSYHPVDREQGYCNRCSWWTGDPNMPDCPKHSLEDIMPICQSCKDAAATGNMNLHCSEQQQCMCQHKSVEEYPTLGKDASHIAGNVDLTDTPQSGAKEVRNF